jgi:hypothetical protein
VLVGGAPRLPSPQHRLGLFFFTKSQRIVISAHCKKSYRFSRPLAGMSLTKLFLAGNIIKIIPARESFVSDIPAGDGKIGNPFLQCGCLLWHGCAEEFSFALAWRTYLGDINDALTVVSLTDVTERLCLDDASLAVFMMVWFGTACKVLVLLSRCFLWPVGSASGSLFRKMSIFASATQRYL